VKGNTHKYSEELSGSMKRGNYLGKLNDYYLLRKDFFPWTYYVHKLVILRGKVICRIEVG